MQYYLDTANVKQICECLDLYPIAGITTNPSIIAKEGDDFWKLLSKIRNIIGKERALFVQVLGVSSADIIQESTCLMEKLAGKIIIKIPVTPEGIKAMKLLSINGVATAATAIFTPQQALMAAKAGACFVAPYINRIDNICGDGLAVLKETITVFTKYQCQCQVLAASFKNVQQVHRASMLGVDAVTITPFLCRQLLEHPLTSASIETFQADWEKCYGPGKLIHTLAEAEN